MNAGRNQLILIIVLAIVVLLCIVLAMVNWGGLWGTVTFSAGFGDSPAIVIQPGSKPQLQVDGGTGGHPKATEPAAPAGKNDELAQTQRLILEELRQMKAGQTSLQAEFTKQDRRITRLEERLTAPASAAATPTACPDGCYQPERIIEAHSR